LEHLCCQVCGTKIPPGGVFYRARTELISGSDGILPDTGESGDAIIDKALSEVKELTEQQVMEEVYQEMVDNIPSKAIGDPADLGAAAAFLAGIQARYITGQNLLIDGGRYSGLL